MSNKQKADHIFDNMRNSTRHIPRSLTNALKVVYYLIIDAVDDVLARIGIKKPSDDDSVSTHQDSNGTFEPDGKNSAKEQRLKYLISEVVLVFGVVIVLEALTKVASRIFVPVVLFIGVLWIIDHSKNR